MDWNQFINCSAISRNRFELIVIFLILFLKCVTTKNLSWEKNWCFPNLLFPYLILEENKYEIYIQKSYIWRQGKQRLTSEGNFEAQRLRRYWSNYTLLPKIYSVWVFSCTLMQCFPLTLTLEYIRSRGSTSSVENNYKETTYDSCKDWLLAYKTGNQIHKIKFKERKVP